MAPLKTSEDRRISWPDYFAYCCFLRMGMQIMSSFVTYCTGCVLVTSKWVVRLAICSATLSQVHNCIENENDIKLKIHHTTQHNYKNNNNSNNEKKNATAIHNNLRRTPKIRFFLGGLKERNGAHTNTNTSHIKYKVWHVYVCVRAVSMCAPILYCMV